MNLIEEPHMTYPSAAEMSQSEPRVLNICMDISKEAELPVVNWEVGTGVEIDVSKLTDLPFKDGHFVLIRSVNILQSMQKEILDKTLGEWKRILHQFGELHLAVPSGTMTFDELEEILISAGFEEVSKQAAEKDLAVHCGVEDGIDKEGLFISARMRKIPHSHDSLLTEKEFKERTTAFVANNPDNPPASFIVAVYNEAKNLQAFLSFLEHCTNMTKTEREFIFVINGCTDDSEKIIRDFLNRSELNAKVISSGMGIVTAFIQGIADRTLNGFIGKLDADVILHPQLLDLMQMHLVENEQVQVTYAEPMPVDSECDFNITDHHPEAMTKRLYYTSKASLNRLDPFAVPAVKNILQGFRAEDMFMSFYFVYFYGLDSISRAPHGHVYAKTVRNYKDLVRQISRMNSEMEREFSSFPAFRVLGNVTEQEFYPGPYKDTFDKANAESVYVDEWTRIESTK